jgi:hypothetical protein
MKYFLILSFIISGNALATFKMKPGLWKIKMEMNNAGKKENPFAQVEKAMANMPAEKKKMIMDMMAKQKVGINSDGAMSFCYTAEMLNKPEKFIKKPDPSCNIKIITNTSSKIVTKFKCDGDSEGTSTMTVVDANNFNTLLEMTNKGKKSKIKSVGSFISSDCGQVKPIN